MLVPKFSREPNKAQADLFGRRFLRERVNPWKKKKEEEEEEEERDRDVPYGSVWIGLILLKLKTYC